MSPVPSFVLRELCLPDALRSFFALRHDVYTRTRALSGLESLDHGSGLDVDAFDRYSRQFGVYECSDSGERLVGGLRVTGLEPTPHLEAMRYALRDAPAGLTRFERERSGVLPAASYSVKRDRLTACVRELTDRGESVVEAGRLVMSAECRTDGSRGALLVARAAVAAITARFFFVTPVSCALIHIRTQHRTFYVPFGFRELEDGGPHPEPALGDATCVSFLGRPAWLAPKVRGRCLDLAQQLRELGEARLLATSATGRPPGTAAAA